MFFIRNEVNLNDEYGPNATNPVEEARERLMDLEKNIERRYLKAPLGITPHVKLQTITTKINNSKNYDDDQDVEENMEEEEPPEETNDNDKPAHIPRGLMMWREGIQNAKTAAQLGTVFLKFM